MPLSIPRQATPYSGMHLAKHGWKCYFQRDYKRVYKCLKTKDKEEAARRKNAFYAKLLRRGAAIAGTPEARKPKSRIRVSRSAAWVGYVDGVYAGRHRTAEEARRACERKLRQMNGEPEPEPQDEDPYL